MKKRKKNPHIQETSTLQKIGFADSALNLIFHPNGFKYVIGIYCISIAVGIILTPHLSPFN